MSFENSSAFKEELLLRQTLIADLFYLNLEDLKRIQETIQNIKLENYEKENKMIADFLKDDTEPFNKGINESPSEEKQEETNEEFYYSESESDNASEEFDYDSEGFFYEHYKNYNN